MTKKRKKKTEAITVDVESLRARVAELERSQPSRQELAIRVLRRRHSHQSLQVLFRGEHALALVDGRPLPLADQVALNETAVRSGVSKLHDVIATELGRIKEAWESRR